MIEFSSKHIPLITYQTSGDTYFIKKIKQNIFFSVIDIAGHGTKKCFLNASKLKKIVENEIELIDFKNILQKMNKEIHDIGAVVLLGKIDTNKGLFEYSCVGNISIKKINSNGDVEIFKTQEGIVGLYLPSEIKKIKGRLKDNEYLLIHTDGIKSSINLSKYFIYNKNTNKVLKMIMERERNIDDALGLLLRYKNEQQK